MKYTHKTFSAPVASPKVSQAQWDAIWVSRVQAIKASSWGLSPKLNKVKAIRKKSKG